MTSEREIYGIASVYIREHGEDAVTGEGQALSLLSFNCDRHHNSIAAALNCVN